MINGIGEKTISTIKQQTNDLIEAHKRKLQEVFLQTGTEELSFTMTTTIMRKGEGLAVETKIKYNVEKVSDSKSAFIQENQAPLFAA